MIELIGNISPHYTTYSFLNLSFNLKMHTGRAASGQAGQGSGLLILKFCQAKPGRHTFPIHHFIYSV